jgi:hypothetical protein
MKEFGSLASLSFGKFPDSVEHDDEHDASAEALAKEDLVADFGVRLRRTQSSRSVERYAALGAMQVSCFQTALSTLLPPLTWFFLLV